MPFGIDNSIYKVEDSGIERVRDYIEVKVLYKLTGQIIPLAVFWADKEIAIDKIIGSCPMKTLKNSKPGIRYKCKIQNRLFYLTYDLAGWNLQKI